MFKALRFTYETGKEYFVKNYAAYCDRLPKSEKLAMMSIQNSGDISYVQDALDKNWKDVPPVMDDFWVFRGGPMHPHNRKYISASFLKEMALHKFAHGNILNCHSILVKKGAKVLPAIALNDWHSDPESEIIICQDDLHFKGFCYVYY